jgi:hypothetical protein
LKWNLDDIPLEFRNTKRFMYIGSSDPNLRALCGKSTDRRATTTTALHLDDTVCGDCNVQVRHPMRSKSKTDKARYECCKYSSYKCEDCVNEYTTSQFPKKCTDDCTPCHGY